MAPSKTDLGHQIKYTGDLIPKSGRHYLRQWVAEFELARSGAHHVGKGSKVALRTRYSRAKYPQLQMVVESVQVNNEGSIEMVPSKTDLGHLVKYTGDLIPAAGKHYPVLRLWTLLYLSRQVEKKEFPLEEDYSAQLHVVDYNLECSFFCLLLNL